MTRYRLRRVVLAGHRPGFEEGLLWQRPDGAWGVELTGVAGLRDVTPNRPVSIAAQSESGVWFMGRVVVVRLGDLDPSDSRLHLSGVDELRTLAT